jgi:hypothetical protein
MPSASFLIFALFVAATAGFPAADGRSGPVGCDTVSPGTRTISPEHLRDFTVVRQLTLTRGDSISPFGTQTETLTSGELDGRPTLLDVLVFDTPRGKTVDSSWIDSKTLKPLRLRSDNAARSVTLEFGDGRVQGRTVPADSAPVITDRTLEVSPFEWNVMALAVSALPLKEGYCASLPVYSDRSGRVSWYQVEVVGDTMIERKSRRPEPVWEVVARADSASPQVRYWISRHHRVVSRVLVSEPGISIMYARD